MLIDNLKDILKEHICPSKPLVVYSSLWPFLALFREQPTQLAPKIVETILKHSPTVLMPSFTSGYQNGICNLDSEPSKTGFLSDFFRMHYSQCRTLSAFFSFCAVGKVDSIAHLQPRHAWGKGSLYHWMEQNDATALMLGTHPTHCSYLHRLEWLARKKISYRYVKAFHGTLIRGQQSLPMSEKLFVRDEKQIVINNFTTLLDPMSKHMQSLQIRNIPISIIKIRDIRKSCGKLIYNDPHIILKHSNKAELT